MLIVWILFIDDWRKHLIFSTKLQRVESCGYCVKRRHTIIKQLLLSSCILLLKWFTCTRTFSRILFNYYEILAFLDCLAWTIQRQKIWAMCLYDYVMCATFYYFLNYLLCVLNNVPFYVIRKLYNIHVICTWIYVIHTIIFFK